MPSPEKLEAALQELLREAVIYPIPNGGGLLKFAVIFSRQMDENEEKSLQKWGLKKVMGNIETTIYQVSIFPKSNLL